MENKIDQKPYPKLPNNRLSNARPEQKASPFFPLGNRDEPRASLNQSLVVHSNNMGDLEDKERDPGADHPVSPRSIPDSDKKEYA